MNHRLSEPRDASPVGARALTLELQGPVDLHGVGTRQQQQRLARGQQGVDLALAAVDREIARERLCHAGGDAQHAAELADVEERPVARPPRHAGPAIVDVLGTLRPALAVGVAPVEDPVDPLGQRRLRRRERPQQRGQQLVAGLIEVEAARLVQDGDLQTSAAERDRVRAAVALPPAGKLPLRQARRRHLDTRRGQRFAAGRRQLVAGERGGIPHRQIEDADLQRQQRHDPEDHDQRDAALPCHPGLYARDPSRRSLRRLRIAGYRRSASPGMTTDIASYSSQASSFAPAPLRARARAPRRT